MMHQLISVIVPIYGIEPYLRKCIDSIRYQTYTNLEIILVDDGSIDGCPQICDEYKKKDSRIKVIHKANGGLVSARKAGLQQATADLIGYVDGDDWIEPDFYENLYKSQAESGADIVTDGFCRDLLTSSEIITNNIPTGLYTDLAKDVYPTMLCAGDYFYFGIYSYVWNKLFKKSILLESQMLVDERIVVGEDLACTFPALLKAKSLCIIDRCAYHYEQRAGSMLKTIDNFAIENKRLDILEEFLRKAFTESQYNCILLPQLERYMSGIRLIRGDTYCEMKKCCYSFGKISHDEKLAICSAGTFGQNLYARMMTKKCCEIVGWFDEDYIEYRKQGLNVQPMTEIKDTNFDQIIIASLDNRFSEKTIPELLHIGIEKEKILTLCQV